MVLNIDINSDVDRVDEVQEDAVVDLDQSQQFRSEIVQGQSRFELCFVFLVLFFDQFSYFSSITAGILSFGGKTVFFAHGEWIDGGEPLFAEGAGVFDLGRARGTCDQF